MSVKPSASTTSPAAAPRGGLRERILRAGSWTLLGHMSGMILRLASTLIMTRILVPEAFGIMAIASVVQIVVALLSDIGIRQAIVQSRRGHEALMLNTAWVLQIIRGGFVYLICLLVAAVFLILGSWQWLPPGSVYSADILPAVIAVTALSALIMGFESTKSMTADRNLDLKRVVLIELTAQLSGLLIMVVAGLLTRSLWALVIGGLVSATVTATLSHLWLRGMPNRFQFDRQAATEIIGFGRWILLSSLLFVLAANGDRLLLGGWMDAATLGLYAIALNLATMVDGAAGRLFTSVAMPALSEVAREDRARFHATYLRLRLPFDLVLLAAAGGLFALAQLVVDIMYDARYADAGYMLQILSFTLVVARYGISGSAYMALGAPKLLVPVHVVKLLALFTLVPLGFWHWGVPGAIWAIALHGTTMIPFIFWYNRRFGLNDFRYEVLITLTWPLGYGAGLLILMLLGR